MKPLTSRRHPIVATFRAAARQRHGAPGSRVLIDGRHLLEEALEARVVLLAAAFTKHALEQDEGRLASRVEWGGTPVYVVADAVMAALSPVRSPTGVVALGTRPPDALETVLAHPPQLVVAVAGVQDPGNLGAIIRSAEAAGATGVVVTGESADPFAWKALRGAMGSVFRVPVSVAPGPDIVADRIRSAGIRMLAAVPSGGRPAYDLDLAGPVAFLVGGEGGGLPAAAIDRADARVSVPMCPPVESLNVAVAAAVLLFEAFRQRHGVGRAGAPDGAGAPSPTGRPDGAR